MAWSDDMRCLHCDGKLPLYRKITNGQFCSAGHRRAYWKEQERLAVERLSQTHDTLRAYHPPAALEASPGAAVKSPISPATEAIARAASNTDRVIAPGFMPGRRPDVQPMWLDQLIAIEPAPTAWAVNAPPLPQRLTWLPSNEIAMALRVEMRLVDWNAFAASTAVMAIEPATVTAPVMTRLSLPASSLTPELDAALLQPPLEEHLVVAEQPAIIEQQAIAEPMAIVEQVSVAEQSTTEQPQELKAEPREIPPLETPLALPQISARDIETVRMTGALVAFEMMLSEPANGNIRLDNIHLDTPALSTARPQALVLRAAASVPGHAVDNSQAIDPRTEPGSPAETVATPSTQPRPRLAQGSRYAVRVQPPAATLAGQVEPQSEPRLPSGFLPMDIAARLPMPNTARILPLRYQATPRVPAATRIAVSTEFSNPQFEGMKPMLAAFRVDPLDGNPEPPPKRNWVSSWMQRSADDPQEKHIWAPAVEFWAHAPRDLKLLAVAIPVLLALALHPSLPKVRVTARTTTGKIQTDVERSLRSQFVNVKQSVADRAGVALNEDFRSGLDEWQVRGEHATAWSFDSTGFVRPASLALYRPSMGLADYEMQFLGLIDKKALSWVVRARDFDNYYVMKLVILKPGPLPTIGVTRYAVIDGKAQNRVDTLAPIAARPDMLYRVDLNVHGDTYLLAVQGKIVDSWSEPRLTRGGIGFFSPRGEESRLRWVQVTHQYDMLGRLCAYLAPYNIPTTNGSW
jgi:hypothetical protein